jgi:hypothetical protein
MRLSGAIPTLMVLFVAAGCSLWPTGDDIDDAIEQELRSVAGSWHGQTSGSNQVVLDLQLSESGSQVTGTGTMTEQAVGTPVAVTVTGTFNRPALSLTISGMSYEGHAVTGTFQTQYNNIVVGGSLVLTGTGYTRTLDLIISED